jgi:hypothetical protein
VIPLAKGLEALGIAALMIGLVQGMLSQTMWMELYLSVIGIGVFLAGRSLEQRARRGHNGKQRRGNP